MILGADNANLPHIVAIIAEAFLKEALPSDNDVAKKLLLIVKQVQVCTSKVASFKSLQIGVVLDTSDLFWKTRCRQITTSPRNCCSWHRQTSTGTFWIKMTSFYSDVIFLLTYFFMSPKIAVIVKQVQVRLCWSGRFICIPILCGLWFRDDSFLKTRLNWCTCLFQLFFAIIYNALSFSRAMRRFSTRA